MRWRWSLLRCRRATLKAAGKSWSVVVHPDARLVEEIRVPVPPEGFPLADGVFALAQPIVWSLLDPGSCDELATGAAAVLLTVEVMAPGV